MDSRLRVNDGSRRFPLVRHSRCHHSSFSLSSLVIPAKAGIHGQYLFQQTLQPTNYPSKAARASLVARSVASVSS